MLGAGCQVLVDRLFDEPLFLLVEFRDAKISHYRIDEGNSNTSVNVPYLAPGNWHPEAVSAGNRKLETLSRSQNFLIMVRKPSIS